MRRREALLALGAASALAASRSALTQAERVRRIGVLLPGVENIALLPKFSRRLRGLGWVEGRNLAIESRGANNDYQRLPRLALELVRLKVEIIVSAATAATLAAKQAAAGIPVVFAWVAEPVASGLVASLGRPGGNVTGLSNVASEIFPKQLDLLRAMLPGLERVAGLVDPKYAGGQYIGARMRDAAGRAGVALVLVEASAADDLERAFAEAARAKAAAMLVPPLPLYGNQRERIARLAVKHGIPTAAQFRSFAEAGGLFSYGTDLTDGFLRTAGYVDKILRGARPADLPVEQSDRFELVINRKTAKSLGLTIPQSVLLQATEVIE